MEELYITGIKGVMSVVEPLIENGYVVKVMLVTDTEQDEENVWNDFVDNDIYCIMYETQTEQ